MRSYALFLALAVLHAHAATIPTPEVKKVLLANAPLDDVSFDNNENEQEVAIPNYTIKQTQSNLLNSIPENVPVKIIEEQPVIKTIPLREDSNDYVPDNDDSTNIKRVEIDLNNPGPPQRQEHDSQKPFYTSVEKERAVAAIKKSIAESQNIFTRGIQDVTQKFQYYFANNKQLNEVSDNIQKLKKNFDAEVSKLSTTINFYLKPQGVEVIEGDENLDNPSGVKEVENRLRTLETSFNTGVSMLSEGVELLTILTEEDEQNLKISGKADDGNTPVETGPSPPNPVSGSGTTTTTGTNPVFEFVQNLNNSIVNALSGLSTSIQNFFGGGQNQQNQPPSTNSTSQSGFNPVTLFQGINLPNFFQQNPNQNQQQQQGSPPAGTQSDDASTERPNILQQIQSTFQNIVNPGQASQQQTSQNQNPISQFFSGVNQGITNLFQGRPQQQPTQQTSQPNNAASVPAPQAAVATPAVAEGTNSVPATPAQVEPITPAKQPETVGTTIAQTAPVPNGSIQQIVQNNPVIKGITNTVQRIQGISNPSKPRDEGAVVENPNSKGHGHGGHSGDNNSSGVNSAPNVASAQDEPLTLPGSQRDGESAA